ncbi:MAG: hypothetical protein PHW95_05490 [Patescibacteria group bacterium]|nr:hypothetical protein [Patescibacteria group bacterium]
MQNIYQLWDWIIIFVIVIKVLDALGSRRKRLKKEKLKALRYKKPEPEEKQINRQKNAVLIGIAGILLFMWMSHSISNKKTENTAQAQQVQNSYSSENNNQKSIIETVYIDPMQKVTTGIMQNMGKGIIEKAERNQKIAIENMKRAQRENSNR